MQKARKTEVKLDFLTKGKKYKATIYEDGKDADWEKNPKFVTFANETLSKSFVGVIGQEVNNLIVIDVSIFK